MSRMVDLAVTTYWWVPGDTKPTTASAVNAGENISQWVVSSTKVGPIASDKISEKSITDTSNAEVPIIGNYEGMLVVHRDMTSGAPTSDDILTTIASTSGVVGWLVKRIGYTSTTAAASGHKVSRYKFMTDNPQPTGGEGDGYLKATIPLLQQGSFDVEVALAS